MARASINWARGLDELGTGLLRQADIGGRAYEGAMATEAETRAESRQISAERRALAAAEAAEKRANIEWARREGIQAGTAAAAAAKLQAGRETVAGMQTDSAEGIAAAGQEGATERARMLIDANIDTAKLLADGRAAKIKQDRLWATEDAVAKAATEEAKQKIEATVSRAKEAEAALAELYKGLGEAGVILDKETQSYTSGSDYMDQIHNAQDRVAAAWRATGIKSLMSDRNINATKWGYLEHSIFGAISLDLKESKPDIWKGIVEGLQSEKSSSDYKAAVETITPYLNDALRMSSMKITTSEKDSIREALIERLGRYEEDAGDGEVTPRTSTTDAGGSDVRFNTQAGDPLDRIDIENLEVGALEKALAEQGGPGKPGARGTEGAQWRDPKWLLPRLESELARLIRQRDAPSRGAGGGRTTSPNFLKKITRVEALILKMKTLLDPEQASTLPDPVRGYPSLAMASPAGMVNPRGGMISAAGLSPAELARWEPEAVEARMA